MFGTCWSFVGAGDRFIKGFSDSFNALGLGVTVWRRRLTQLVQPWDRRRSSIPNSQILGWILTSRPLFPHDISGLHDASWGQAVVPCQKYGLLQCHTQCTAVNSTVAHDDVCGSQTWAKLRGHSEQTHSRSPAGGVLTDCSAPAANETLHQTIQFLHCIQRTHELINESSFWGRAWWHIGLIQVERPQSLVVLLDLIQRGRIDLGLVFLHGYVITIVVSFHAF